MVKRIQARCSTHFAGNEEQVNLGDWIEVGSSPSVQPNKRTIDIHARYEETADDGASSCPKILTISLESWQALQLFTRLAEELGK